MHDTSTANPGDYLVAVALRYWMFTPLGRALLRDAHDTGAPELEHHCERSQHQSLL